MAKQNMKDPKAIEAGRRIKTARVRKGYKSAKELVQKIPGWGNSRLGNYESGQSMAPREACEKIAKVLDISVPWIMFGIGSIDDSYNKSGTEKASQIDILVEYPYLPGDMAELLQIYSMLNQEGKGLLIETGRLLTVTKSLQADGGL